MALRDEERPGAPPQEPKPDTREDGDDSVAVVCSDNVDGCTDNDCPPANDTPSGSGQDSTEDYTIPEQGTTTCPPVISVDPTNDGSSSTAVNDFPCPPQDAEEPNNGFNSCGSAPSTGASAVADSVESSLLNDVDTSSQPEQNAQGAYQSADSENPSMTPMADGENTGQETSHCDPEDGDSCLADKEVNSSTSRAVHSPSVQDHAAAEKSPEVETTLANQDRHQHGSRFTHSPPLAATGSASALLPPEVSLPDPASTRLRALKDSKYASSMKPKPNSSVALQAVTNLANSNPSTPPVNPQKSDYNAQTTTGRTNQRGISEQDWHEIYATKGLLQGFRAGVREESDRYTPAQNIFELPAAEERTYRLSTENTTSSEELKSATFHDVVSSGFSQAEWDFALKASLEVSAVYKSSRSKTKTDKASTAAEEHILISFGNFHKASISLTAPQLRLTKACRDAANEIVQTKTFDSVVNFIEKFGVLFATEVALGGSLFSTERYTSTSQDERRQLENKFRIAFQSSFAFPPVVSAKADAGSERGDEATISSMNQISQDIKSWKQIGGLGFAAVDAKAWIESLSQPKHWGVIKRRGVEKVVTLVSRYPGLEDFETIYNSVLKQGRPQPLWLNVVPCELSAAHLDKELLPLALHDFSVGQGINLATGQLLDSLDSAPKLEHDELGEHVEWSVYADAADLTGVLVQSLPYGQANFSLDYVPHYLGNIRVSESSKREKFTVLTTWLSVGTETHPNPTVSFDPTRLAEEKMKLDPDRFKTEYGDHFITGFERRSVAIVVWVVDCENPETKQRLVTACKRRFQDQPAAVTENSRFMEDLVKDQPAFGKAYVYTSSADSGSLTMQDAASSSFHSARLCLQRHSKDVKLILTRIRLEPYARKNDFAPTRTQGDSHQWAEAWKLLYLARNLLAVALDDAAEQGPAHSIISEKSRDLDETEKRLLLSRRAASQDQRDLTSLVRHLSELYQRLQRDADANAEQVAAHRQQLASKRRREEDEKKEAEAKRLREEAASAKAESVGCCASLCLIM